MSLSNSRLAYQDCYDLLDRALEESRGIRVSVPTINAATYLRMRMHHARTIARQENKRTYEDPAHPFHGRSPYDILVIRVEGDDDRAWLYLDKQKVEIGAIEPIPEDHRPQRVIEPPSEEIVIENPTEIEPQRLIPYIRRR